MLLPEKEVPEHAVIGDELNVFLYKDSKDRLIATTRQPKLELGQVGMLKSKRSGKDRSISGLGTGKRYSASI